MLTVGLVGAGNMGCGLGWALREGGHPVITSLDGRSVRTARLVGQAGIAIVPTLADVVAQSDVILVVTPPQAALVVAGELAALGGVGTPLVAELNAIAPMTAYQAMEILNGSGIDMVDGAVSGPPPTTRAGARIYLSGPRAAEIAGLSWAGKVEPIVAGERVGAASAVKMSTASVYKGLTALVIQALRSAHRHGVREQGVADLGPDYVSPHGIALSASKAERFVPEMRQIAASQEGAGLNAALFQAFAEVWADISRSELATTAPEAVSREITIGEVIERLS